MLVGKFHMLMGDLIKIAPRIISNSNMKVENYQCHIETFERMPLDVQKSVKKLECVYPPTEILIYDYFIRITF